MLNSSDVRAATLSGRQIAVDRSASRYDHRPYVRPIYRMATAAALVDELSGWRE